MRNKQENKNNRKPGEKDPAKKANKAVRILWITFISFLVVFPLLILAIDHGLVGEMPSLAELENPQNDLSTDVLAADGTMLGRYFVTDRSNSTFRDTSLNVIHALLAAEDERFFDHAGIDPIATVAIPFYAIIHKKRGSSTLTQQLAKNLFKRKSSNIFVLPFVKLKEWVLAVKLERNLTKLEIINLYLNTVPFGDNVFGIKNASLTFYSVLPENASVDQAAALIAMLKGNSIYNPRSHPKQSKARRNTVLDQMYKYGYITEAQANDLKSKETPLNYHKLDYHGGIAPYFRMIVEMQVKQMIKDLKKPDGTPYDIYKDGLKIWTTLDVKMQGYAEEAMQEHLTNWQKTFLSQPVYKDGTIWNKEGPIQTILNQAIKSSDRYLAFRNQDMTEAKALAQMKVPVKMKVFAWNKNRSLDTVMSPMDSLKYMKLFLQAGFMAMDPATGEVKAWVGGIDHNYFQFDHVNINAKRQVGSTIKPLLYTFAVDNGFDPCSSIETTPQDFPTKTGYNADKGASYDPHVTMKEALAKSINNAALYVLRQVGIDPFVDFVQKCGITSRIDKVPAVALGVSDISLTEMLGAYSMFPGKGINTQPYYITKIEDKNGTVLKTFAPVQKEIINDTVAYKMVNMMRGVVNFGTGARLRGKYQISSDIAGKTGTTSNQADAWFIGYSPDLIAGAWVGCNDREFRFRREELGQGAASALPIWALFMKKVWKDDVLSKKYDPRKTFPIPKGWTDCVSADTLVHQPPPPGTEINETSGEY